MSEQEIKTKIKSLKAEMQEVKGTPCEVFSRVVGYLRPVQNYNKGKKQEYFLRSKFDICHACK